MYTLECCARERWRIRSQVLSCLVVLAFRFEYINTNASFSLFSQHPKLILLLLFGDNQTAHRYASTQKRSSTVRTERQYILFMVSNCRQMQRTQSYTDECDMQSLRSYYPRIRSVLQFFFSCTMTLRLMKLQCTLKRIPAMYITHTKDTKHTNSD